MTGTGERWKPFPWNYLPDKVALVWGGLELLFIAPLAALLITSSEVTWWAILKVWRHPSMTAVKLGIKQGVENKFSIPMGKIMLKDPRNHSYIPWISFLAVFAPFLFFWALRRYQTYGLEFSTLFIYHFLRIGPRFRFFARIHTLVHKEGHDHKGFWKPGFQVFDNVCQWWIGPFYGQVPGNYSVAHMKIHHRWHNDVDDVHTNLDLDRTNILSFLMYTPRFTLYWTGVTPLALFINRGEWKLCGKILYGMITYYGVTLLLFCWSPVFCLAYWVFPHMEAIILLSAISYLWHAFVEESDPGNQYVNSVTILDGQDNVWNEDFHVVHHHSPSTHWTDAPKHFEEHKHLYAACTATIFRDCEQGLLLKWLFENNWDEMAAHFVDLNGKLTHEEKKALIVRRLKVVVGESGRDGKRLGREWASTSSIRNWDHD